jgi:SNF2 family DNA or RNA helicase
MWSLFDFCCPGLLGDSRFFKEEYERKITTGQNRDASERQRHVGIVTSQVTLLPV